MLKTALLALLIFFISVSNAKAQVVINEFSSNTSSDWIELFSSEDVDISSWVLDDYGTATNMKTIPESTFIGPSTSEYYIVEVSSRLNKDGDEISLYDKNNSLKDSLVYGDKGGPCLPSDVGSIGRYPDANNTVERFSTHTKGADNSGGSLDPCPTLTPTSTSVSSSTPTVTPTPTPSSTPTKTPSPTPRPTSTKKPTSSPSPQNGEEEVLGFRNELSIEESPTPSPEVLGDTKGNFPLASVFFLLGGATFVGIAGFSFFKQRRVNYTGESEKEDNDLP